MRTMVYGGASPKTSKLSTPVTGEMPESAQELHIMYRELSNCLDNIQDLLQFLNDPKGMVCLTVLEDDVCDLLEECGEYLLMDDDPEVDCLNSLECRTSTVIEEIKGVLRPAPSVR